jgi:hypothetical protein
MRVLTNPKIKFFHVNLFKQVLIDLNHPTDSSALTLASSITWPPIAMAPRTGSDSRTEGIQARTLGAILEYT